MHAAVLFPRDEPRMVQDAQMLRDGGQRHFERARQLAYRSIVPRETREHRPARRIGERRESRVERRRG